MQSTRLLIVKLSRCRPTKYTAMSLANYRLGVKASVSICHNRDDIGLWRVCVTNTVHLCSSDRGISLLLEVEVVRLRDLNGQEIPDFFFWEKNDLKIKRLVVRRIISNVNCNFSPTHYF